MTNKRQIREYVRKLTDRFHPQRVVLFGSHAYGRPTSDSDVDLLVIMQYKGHPAFMASEIRKRIRAGVPLDLVVRSPEEIQHRLAIGDGFIREIVEQGKPLYED